MKKYHLCGLSVLIFLFFSFFGSSLQAGTTGKIVGKVVDASTGKPLIGVNVIVVGTQMGAATDENGDYLILNIPPGRYTLRADMIGYKSSIIKNIIVNVDFTSHANFTLVPTTIQGQAVTVVATKPLVRMDLTSTSQSVGADQIAQLPVEEVHDIVNLQAGVVNGHFRGGRLGEVAYMVDGVPINDVFSGSAGVNVENNAVQELEVISGTFNAEYGQAMSGVVNIVTRSGGGKTRGSLNLYSGDYVSTHKDLFLNIGAINPLSNKSLEGTLEGTVPKTAHKLGFFMTSRLYDNQGWLYGQRRFVPSDSSNLLSEDRSKWYIEETGDNKMVPMNPNFRISGLSKLTYRLSGNDKISYNFIYEYRKYREYDHRFKYDPDGDYKRFKWNNTQYAIWTHVFSPETFASLRLSHSYNKYDQYVFKDPLDPRFVNPSRLLQVSGNAFYTGGMHTWQFHRNTKSWVAKFDLTSQVNKQNQIKVGVEAQSYELYLHEFEIRMDRETHWKPALNPIWAWNNNEYQHYPYSFSSYAQDKMEFKDMIVNIGLRFDYFNSNASYPKDPRDTNIYEPILPQHKYKNYNPNLPFEKQTPFTLEERKKFWYKKATPKMQLSPRFGIAYPISDQGVIHVSYGFFFQMPNFEYLYTNPEFEVFPGQNEPLDPMPHSQLNTMGNPDLKPQKTVIYEIGLQQQLTDNLGLTFTTYYKDIRNWLGTEINQLYIVGRQYAKYVNRDYANVRGITIALDQRPVHGVSASLDYTFQIAKGDASDPNTAFWDKQNNIEPTKQFVPLDWDRRHSLNISVAVGSRRTWNLSLIGKLGSGLPYTPTYQNIRLSVANSANKPPFVNFDLYAYRNLHIMGLNYSFYVKIYNLFDRKNELNVYSDTGRAGYSLQSFYTNTNIRGINTLDEFLKRPDWYSAPRQIITGIKISVD